MKTPEQCSPEEQARLAAGLPVTEQMAILCDDREFYLYCRAAWPHSPSLWVDLPGCPENVKRRYAKFSVAQEVAARSEFFGSNPASKTDRFFQRYFLAPDLKEDKRAARMERFADASAGWDIP